MSELTLSLSIFNGPLDLLLHLVKEEKIEIRDIFVSEVTAQFLCYMDQLDNLDVDLASDYMAMAATLLEIKSRALLPVMPGDIEPEDSPERLLIRQLEEYKMFKEASEELKKHETVNRLYKQPDKAAGKVMFAVRDMSLDNLLDAFAHIMHKMELSRLSQNTLREIKKDSFSINDKIAHIKEYLTFTEMASFYQLFDEDATKLEVVVTFMALLELVKGQAVKAMQTNSFDDIILTRGDNFHEDVNYEE